MWPYMLILQEIRNLRLYVDLSIFAFTVLLTNYEIFTTDTYKMGLVKNRMLRAIYTSSSWSIFHERLERLYKILQQNSFPRFLIDQIVSSFIKLRKAKILL